ncbi:hypothetical protein HYFRA_00010489 [Hymenoscyphus fraxineus]|uniref:Uncharacterized protein n=1 Tax=Hymenoscyphus fraxineus TaxID=746836 RepID=A0A9N9PXH0_9HELO|nr:hypothetical protein HYFRA_00010489 [Hymenoscyphus fraxineus]
MHVFCEIVADVGPFTPIGMGMNINRDLLEKRYFVDEWSSVPSQIGKKWDNDLDVFPKTKAVSTVEQKGYLIVYLAIDAHDGGVKFYI